MADSLDVNTFDTDVADDQQITTTKQDKSVKKLKNKKAKPSLFGRQFVDEKELLQFLVDLPSYYKKLPKHYTLSQIDHAEFIDLVKSRLVNEFDLKRECQADQHLPSVLIYSSAALRCIGVVKQVKSRSLSVVKCFARHIKVQEQVDIITNNPIQVAIGTPARLRTIQEYQMGEVKLFSQVSLVILDLYKDAKDRTLFDVPECLSELVLSIRQLCKSNTSLKIAFLPHSQLL